MRTRFTGGGPLDGDARDIPPIATGYVMIDEQSSIQHRYKRIGPDLMEYAGSKPARPADEHV